MVAYSFKRRFIDPIRAGLGMSVETFDCSAKRQTIRAVGKRRHARADETLQLYHGMRSRDCFRIGEAHCRRVREIRIFIGARRIIIGDQPAIVSNAGLDQFAIDDGFADWADMQQFWRDEHGDMTRLGPFVGMLIEWEPIVARNDRGSEAR